MMATVKPCPFCGHEPEVGPADDSRGSCWGYVKCVNERCPAQPEVEDGIGVNDERGRRKYIAAAVRRWNRRA